jgi:hypothetical protein
MKNCLSCGNMLSDEAAYCHFCNTHQTSGFEEFEPKPAQSDIFLKVLCWLTIIGASIDLVGIPFALASVSQYNIEVPKIMIGLTLFASCSKLAGAVFMLRKRLVGLYIYTGAAALNIFHWIYVSGDLASKDIYQVVGEIIGFSILILFAVMYWLPVNKRLLN